MLPAWHEHQHGDMLQDAPPFHMPVPLPARKSFTLYYGYCYCALMALQTVLFNRSPVLPFSYLWSPDISHTAAREPPVRCSHPSWCCVYLLSASYTIVCYLQQFLMTRSVVSLILLN